MPKVLIRGHGKPEYEYVVHCTECFSYLVCQECEFNKNNTEHIMGIDYPIEMIYCEVCHKNIRVKEHLKYKFPKGLFNIIDPIRLVDPVDKFVEKLDTEDIKKNKKVHPSTLNAFELLSISSPTKRRKVHS